MLFNELHADAPGLPEETSQKLVEYCEKRLEKYCVDSVLPHQEKPMKLALVVPSDELEVGKLLGQGSFSSAYEITSLALRHNLNANNDEESTAASTTAADDDLSFGDSTTAASINNNVKLVVKVLQPKLIQNPSLFAGCAADLVREGLLLRRLQHPHIVTCHGTIGGIGVQSFANGRHDAFGLLLERLDKTLKVQLKEWRAMKAQRFSLLQLVKGKRRKRSILQRTDLLCELAQAIQYLHAHRIIHRDLKPDNLGIVQNGTTLTLKVFDLDVCRVLPQEGHRDQAFQLTKRVGSPRYMSPEVARGESYGTKADVYSFGLVMYEVLSLQKPYEDIPASALESRVFHQGARPSCPMKWPGSVKYLVQQCWSAQANQRPSMAIINTRLRETLDWMCPVSELKQRSVDISKVRQRTTSLEESRTQRSELTLEVSAQ